MKFEIEAEITGTRTVTIEAENAAQALALFEDGDYHYKLNEDDYSVQRVLSITEVNDNEAMA